MSRESWHNYGYGICTSTIMVDDPNRVKDLLSTAPKYHEKVKSWLKECGIENPTVDDYEAFDQDYYLGMATLLKEVIEEAEGVTMTACDDESGACYLLYQPVFPWQMGDRDKDMTEEKLNELFGKYVRILTDTPVDVEEQAVANSG